MKHHCTEHKQARVNSVGDRKTPLLVILFSLLITGCGSSSFAQSSSAKTAVLIIGTVHSGNRHITPKTLGKVLSDFSPDIVLIEQDEDFKPVFGLFAAYWLRIARPPMEQLAEQRFHRKNKHIPILAYDTMCLNDARGVSAMCISVYWPDSFFPPASSQILILF